MATKLAFIAYETPFAPSGGIAAVMGRLPASLKNASPFDIVVLTPFHHKIDKTTKLSMQDVGNTTIRYCDDVLTVSYGRVSNILHREFG